MTGMTGLLAQESTSVYHEFTRFHTMTEWWQWMLFLTLTLAVFAVIIYLYIRDTEEVSSGVRIALLVLRVFAFLGILFYFFDLEKRSRKLLVKPSRVIVMVDTSQSMGLRDAQDNTSLGPSRIEQVVQELSQGELLENLRQSHDVALYKFDQGNKPTQIAALPKLSPTTLAGMEDRDPSAMLAKSLKASQILAIIAGVLLAISIFMAVISMLLPSKTGEEQGSYTFLTSVVTLIAAVIVFAVANLRTPEASVLTILNLQEPQLEEQADPDSEDKVDPIDEINWPEALIARGSETRLGESLRFIVNQERGGPIAGIIVLTDGNNNAGIDYIPAAFAAKDAGIQVYPIGLGSDERPTNVRVADLDVPQRVYPGDRFNITSYIQAFGLEGKNVRVELSSRLVPAGATEATDPFEFQMDKRVALSKDGELQVIKFEADPEEEGRYDYKVRVIIDPKDHDEKDDERAARVEVIERRTKVLLLAGGPSREFRFLRNLLYRDDEIETGVLLQTGKPGMSQEADELYFDFPDTEEELFQYDCIIGFDPDWLKLNLEQIELLERWVAEKAGGLIVVAGPVNTPQWTRFGSRQADERIKKLRDLYPAVMYRPRSATFSLGRFGSPQAWPVEFTRDGREAEFLWLEDDAVGSEQAWTTFKGVYGYYAVKEPKPGARIYARFADPSTKIDNELPIYMAGHFYGAGRVFFQASGEMWRVREIDDTYFETYYTKLIRWVSQGRLFRDSTQAVLLVDKERCLLGDHVVIQAILMDLQHRPMDIEEYPGQLIQPDGTPVALTLRKVKDATRPGMYSAQFTATSEGDYRVELKVLANDGEQTLLTKEVRARVPALEIEQPERDDALLSDLADKTDGSYYVGIAGAMGRGTGTVPVANVIDPRPQSVPLPGTPDMNFERTLMAWLMGLICGALCLEWLIRRVCRLA